MDNTAGVSSEGYTQIQPPLSEEAICALRPVTESAEPELKTSGDFGSNIDVSAQDLINLENKTVVEEL